MGNFMPKNTNSLINIYHPPPPPQFLGCGDMQSNNHKNHPVGGTATVQDLTRTNKNKILCSRCTPHRMTAAFTLVELAIVLVIIGLVIGGVFVGQDLIYSAQLRATMQDIEKYSCVSYGEMNKQANNSSKQQKQTNKQKQHKQANIACVAI